MKNNPTTPPYLLLTPGPLTTSPTVKEAMLRDWCTWDKDYNSLVQDLRARLLSMHEVDMHGYTTVLMQGSGSFVVESVIGSMMPDNGKLLVLVNGAYGQRMATMARCLRIPTHILHVDECTPLDPSQLRDVLVEDPAITHVAAVHVETTTGMLNPIAAIGKVAKEFGKIYLVDSMSGLGGISMDIPRMGADFVISSANKCIQGVPGFGFVVAKLESLQQCRGRARSHALDLYDQWQHMEQGGGKWRFTSPTHVVRAFYQALLELEQEGGVPARQRRYSENHCLLVDGMRRLGFATLLDAQDQSPIITSFLSPVHPDYRFERFYMELKQRGFVIYPGKVTQRETFRIGNIGHLFPEDMRRLLVAVEQSRYWQLAPVQATEVLSCQ